MKPSDAVSGVVSNIQRYSIQDGPGIRTTVFLKGCPLRCGWCSNPETQNMDVQLSPDPETGEVRQLGKRMTVEEVMQVVRRDRPFFDGSDDGGLTVSGGEVLAQPAFSAALLRTARAEGIHTCIATSGYGSFETAWPVFESCDLILFDLKGMDDAKHRRNTGVSNRMIHQNLEQIMDKGKQVIVRVPVIPGQNATVPELQEIVDFAVRCGVKRIEFLSYHRLGESKYTKLARAYPWEGVATISPQVYQNMLDQLKAPGDVTLIPVN